MGYKHSPANAKMSAFMNKMNNTEKSPARQSKGFSEGDEEDTRSDNRKLIMNRLEQKHITVLEFDAIGPAEKL